MVFPLHKVIKIPYAFFISLLCVTNAALVTRLDLNTKIDLTADEDRSKLLGIFPISNSLNLSVL